MKTTLITLVTALALGSLAACDRNHNQPASKAPSSAASGTSAAPQSSTPSTPANAGTPSQAEKRDGQTPPVQGQVDSKDGPQQKDFQHKGDGAGPKPGG